MECHLPLPSSSVKSVESEPSLPLFESTDGSRGAMVHTTHKDAHIPPLLPFMVLALLITMPYAFPSLKLRGVPGFFFHL